MQSVHTPSHTFTRRALLLGLAGTAAHLAGCGGGGTDVAGLSSGGTGSFTSGPITGLGSIIVNGIRYNDDTATVVPRDDDVVFNGPLKEGMVVSIQGSSVTPASVVGGTSTATAVRISCGSEWVGPVGTVAGSSFQVLGNTVDVLTNTVFDGAASQLSDLNTSHYVEVYGYVDPTTHRLQATRVEASLTPPSSYRLSGSVSQWNASTRSFTLGATAIIWAVNALVPTTWGNDSLVRVRLDPLPVGGVWTATRIVLVSAGLSAVPARDHDEVELHGVITAWVSSTFFSVNGWLVTASAATLNGTPALGANVEVQGSFLNGTVVATQVEVQSRSSLETHEFEYHGTVSQLDTTAQSFVLRNRTFFYNSNTQFQGVNWQVNASPQVEIKAIRSNGVWLATSVALDT